MNCTHIIIIINEHLTITPNSEEPPRTQHYNGTVRRETTAWSVHGHETHTWQAGIEATRPSFKGPVPCSCPPWALSMGPSPRGPLPLPPPGNGPFPRPRLPSAAGRRRIGRISTPPFQADTFGPTPLGITGALLQKRAAPRRD